MTKISGIIAFRQIIKHIIGEGEERIRENDRIKYLLGSDLRVYRAVGGRCSCVCGVARSNIQVSTYLSHQWSSGF